MPTALVSSSVSGFSEGSGTTVTTPVPAGTAAGHIVLLGVELWNGAAATVTWPAGFTEVVNVTGVQKLLVAWKRLTGADTGNYVATSSTSQSWTGHCQLISGALASGNPIEATNTATSAVLTTAIPSVTVTTATQAFLAHIVATEQVQPAASSVPPTGYTLTQQGADFITNYRIPGAAGSHTASGGTVGVASNRIVAALVAIMPAATVVASGTLAGVLPAITGSVTAAAKVSATTAGTLPGLTGSVTAAAKVSATTAGTLPGLTGSVTATVALRASTFAGTLPAITGTLAGNVVTAAVVSGTLAGTLPAITSSVTTTVRVTSTATGTLPALTGSATSTVKVGATLAGALPSLTGAITATVTNPVSAVLAGVLPGLTSALTGVLGGRTDLTVTIAPTRFATDVGPTRGAEAGAGPTRAGIAAGDTRAGTTVAPSRRDRG